MNKILVTISIMCLPWAQLSAQTGIGTVVPLPNATTAELEVASTDKGVLIPRMTDAQMQAIVSPAEGLMVYNLTKNVFYYFKGPVDGWKPINFLSRSKIADADNNTSMDVDLTGNGTDNTIHFDINGSQLVQLTSTKMDILTPLSYYGIDGEKVLWANGTNTYLGRKSGNTNAVSNNTFIGYGAGINNNSNGNTFVGTESGNSNITGTSNVSSGSGALFSNTSGNYNTAIGYHSGNKLNSSTNLLIGSNAGQNISSGNNNIIIGANAGSTLQTGSNNILIGSNIDVANSATSNTLNIANTIFVNNGKINFNNQYTFPTATGVGTAGMTLTTDGAGQLYWDDVQAASDADLSTISGAAADMQPFSIQLQQGTLNGNLQTYFIRVKAFCNADISRITTYMTAATAGTLQIGFYTYETNKYVIDTLADGSLAKGSIAFTNTQNGYLTYNFPSKIHVDAGKDYYIALYSNIGTVQFIYKQNNAAQISASLLTPPLPDTWTTSVYSQDKLFWVRAY